MSRIVTTKLGRFRAVTDDGKKWWLWECPRCKTWGNLSLDQLEGRTSVYCEAPMQYRYPLAVRPCGYHETHEYAKELAVTIQAKYLFGETPWAEDDENTPPKYLFVEDENGNAIPYTSATLAREGA